MGNRIGSKFGWHSGVLTAKDAKIRGDLYVQDDIVFSDVSAGTLGVTGGIDMASTTSAIGIDMGGTYSSDAILIDGTCTKRALMIGTKNTGLKISSGLGVDVEPANNYLFGLFSAVQATEATSTDELRSAWIRTRVNVNCDIGSAAGWGYGVCGAEIQLKFYGGTTSVYAWQNSALWAQLESQAATTTFQSGSYTQCVLANIGLTSATLASGAVIAGVTINANTTSLTNTGDAYYGLFITDKNTTSTDFTSAIWIANSIATTGITIGTCTTAITAVSPVNITLTAPTAQINAVYGLINASAISTGNLVAVRGKVIVTGTTAKVSKTAVWAGIELSTVYTETGLTCAVNAQISSSSAQCPNSIVHIQSLPLSGGNFANVPYLCFSEGINAAPAGTGSNILFEVGHNAATTVPTIGTGKLFYQNTLQIAVNQTAGVRTAFYIPLSTAEASYTTAYPIVSSKATGTNVSITNTALTVGDAYSGLRVTVTEAAANNAYGIAAYFDTTISGATAGHCYGIGSWVNIADGAIASSGNIITPYEGGIYEGAATMTNAKLCLASYQAQLTNTPNTLHIFRINSTKTITAIFRGANAGSLGWVAGAGTSGTQVGYLPIADIEGVVGTVYVRVYNSAT